MRVTKSPVFLHHIITDVKSGALLPAGMQRPYVWRKADVLAFCESLIDELPIGNIFTWKPKKDIDPRDITRNRLGPILADDIKPHARLILDGQNRLATFAWMLGGKTPDNLSDAEVETWANEELVIDALENGFLFVPKGEAECGLRISASVCESGNINPLLRKAFSRWREEGYAESTCDMFLARISQITDSIQHARLVETTISDASPQEAKNAFLKICRTGVPITQDDFDAALSWLPDTSA